MIHYHGTPITPNKAALDILMGRHGLVSFRNQQTLPIVIEVCSSFVLDNGAFTAWRAAQNGKAEPITDWQPYYDWVDTLKRHPGFDWALIPDVIDGTEDENDALMDEWPDGSGDPFGVPVWHLHESLDRLEDLAKVWPRVALGSSGEYATPNSPNWWVRIKDAMKAVCDERGQPKCKLHGLRMLNPAIFTRLPLSSADSCNVGLNIGNSERFDTTPYPVLDKGLRGEIIAVPVEAAQSAARWLGEHQLELAIQG